MWEEGYMKINLMCWILHILIYSYWHFADQKEITNYIHHVSPVKSSSKTAYFDCLFQMSIGQTSIGQTSIGQTRAVCFAPDNQPV